jgi:hypothetical protein
MLVTTRQPSHACCVPTRGEVAAPRAMVAATSRALPQDAPLATIAVPPRQSRERTAHLEHRLDPGLAHLDHPRPRIIAPRGRERPSELGACSTLRLPVLEKAPIDHRNAVFRRARRRALDVPSRAAASHSSEARPPPRATGSPETECILNMKACHGGFGFFSAGWRQSSSLRCSSPRSCCAAARRLGARSRWHTVAGRTPRALRIRAGWFRRSRSGLVLSAAVGRSLQMSTCDLLSACSPSSRWVSMVRGIRCLCVQVSARPSRPDRSLRA